MTEYQDINAWNEVVENYERKVQFLMLENAYLRKQLEAPEPPNGVKE